jgi:hypothetical protein
VQPEHADLVVFPAVADHLAATGKEHEIRGAVPLFNHVQTFVDLSAQRFRMQIPTEENCLDGLAQFGKGVVGWVQRAQGDLPSALSSYKQGLEIAQKLAARESDQH